MQSAGQTLPDPGARHTLKMDALGGIWGHNGECGYSCCAEVAMST